MFFWWMVLIVSVVVYGVLTAQVLPHSFLKTDFVVSKTRDRGLKNVKETIGRSIVFQPSIGVRKYVPQYVVSERNGTKTLVCKIAGGVEYIDYNVVLFNGANKPFGVLNAKEQVTNGYTEPLRLDSETAYVSIVLNAVDEEEFDHKTLKRVTGGKITTYIFASVVLSVLQIFLMKACCSYIFGGVFRESFMILEQSNAFTVLIATAVSIVNVVCILIAVRRCNRKNNYKGEK